MAPPRDPTELLDITGDICPFTLVRVKLRIERMREGDVLDIRLNSGEPLENVPRGMTELGHQVESIDPEDPSNPNGVHRLRIRCRQPIKPEN